MPSKRSKLILLSAQQVLAFLLRQDFKVDSTNPIVPVPTYNGLTYYDSGGIMSVSGGKLAVNGTAYGAMTGFHTATQLARVCGRAFAATVSSRTAVGMAFGWDPSSGAAANGNLTIGVDYANVTTFRVKSGVGVIANITVNASNPHSFVVVMRGTGGWVFLRDAASGNYKLIWVYNTTSTDQYGKFYIGNSSAPNYLVDDTKVVDLGAPYTTDYGPATVYQSSPTTGAISSPADLLFDFSFTMNAGVNIEIRYRVQDASNYWAFSVVDAAGSGQGRIDQVVAGVGTNRAVHNAGYVYGTTYRVLGLIDGNTHSVYRNDTVSLSYTDPGSFLINQTGSIIQTLGGSPANFVIWPRLHDLDAALAGGSVVSSEDYSTDRPLGFAARHRGAPGPGDWLVYDLSNRMSISGEVLNFSGNGSAWGEPKYVSVDSFARVAGRTLFAELIQIVDNANCYIGWVTTRASSAFGNTGVPAAFSVSAGAPFTLGGLGGAGIGISATHSGYVAKRQALTLRTSGFFHFMQDSGTRWRLLWVGNLLNSTPLFATYQHSHVASLKQVKAIRVYDLPGSFASDYGFALNRSTFTAANGTPIENITPEIGGNWLSVQGTWDIQGNKANPATLVSLGAMTVVPSTSADVIIEATLNFSALTATYIGILFRYVDNNNYWLVNIRSDGSFKLFEVTGGVTTERASVSHSAVQGVDYRVIVAAEGARIASWLHPADGSVGVTPGPTYTTAATGLAATSHGIWYASGSGAGRASADNFVVWPRIVTMPSAQL